MKDYSKMKLNEIKDGGEVMQVKYCLHGHGFTEGLTIAEMVQILVLSYGYTKKAAWNVNFDAAVSLVRDSYVS